MLSMWSKARFTAYLAQTVDRVAVIAGGAVALEANMSDLTSEHSTNLEDFMIEKMSGG